MYRRNTQRARYDGRSRGGGELRAKLQMFGQDPIVVARWHRSRNRKVQGRPPKPRSQTFPRKRASLESEEGHTPTVETKRQKRKQSVRRERVSDDADQE
jgi:hypothetical protein